MAGLIKRIMSKLQLDTGYRWDEDIRCWWW